MKYIFMRMHLYIIKQKVRILQDIYINWKFTTERGIIRTCKPF